MISVIIPCYNAESTLERAVSSCLNQSEVAQIVIVDDVSTDGSLGLAQDLAARHSQVKFLRLSENSGPASARNVGILHSDQSILAFLDADDEYLDGGLSLAYQALSQHTHLAAVKLPCEFVDCPDKYTSHPSFSDSCTVLSNTFAGNLMVRREVLFALGLFPQHSIFRQHGGEDGVLMVLLRDLFLVGLVENSSPSVRIHFHANAHSQFFFESNMAKHDNPDFIESRDEVWHYSVETIRRVKADVERLRMGLSHTEKGFVPIWKPVV